MGLISVHVVCVLYIRFGLSVFDAVFYFETRNCIMLSYEDPAEVFVKHKLRTKPPGYLYRRKNMGAWNNPTLSLIMLII